jgi:glycosyltransferase involved in cell wall biosynthesis
MTRRLKILHIVVAGQIGGAERFLADLAARPTSSNADHTLALLTPNRNLTAFFRHDGVTVHDRGDVHENPFAYLWRSYGPADIAWLGRVIERERPDILHCHTYGSHVLAARAALRFALPLVRTEHGVRHYRDPTCGLNRHWALKHTTKIVAVSAFVGRIVAAIEPAMTERICVIHNGIDLTRFAPEPPPAHGPFTVAAVARLEPVKRLEIAIAALAQMPEVQLDIVGDGAERHKLETLAQHSGASGRVRFHGHLADPRSVIAAADAVINCTREEALSLSILEAGAMQRPAIAIGQGGIPEAVVDGHTGWLTKEDGAAAFTATLRQAAADRAEVVRRGIAARDWVAANFAVEAMCEAYGAVYRSLVPGE